MTCPVCHEPLSDKQVRNRRTYCSKGCAGRSRGAAFRGVECKFDGCEASPRSLGYCDRHRQRLKANGYITPERPDEDQRFAASFTVGDPNECWEWQGEIHTFGYGVFCTYQNARRTRHLAHRLALSRTGVEIDGLVVRHRCDNPPCVNPNHLETGTQADNIRDALTRDRMDISGLLAEYPKRCRSCGSDFMGRPSRRYCSACRVAWVVA